MTLLTRISAFDLLERNVKYLAFFTKHKVFAHKKCLQLPIVKNSILIMLRITRIVSSLQMYLLY